MQRYKNLRIASDADFDLKCFVCGRGHYGCDFVDLCRRNLYNGYVEASRIQRLTPVGLAFIGDAVYTLYMRERVLSEIDGIVGTLHTAATRFVNAGMQAAVFDRLTAEAKLTAEELDIARRAKNAHLHSRAKGASVDDYHKATALEAVIGFVHLSGEAEREREILKLCGEYGDALVAKRKNP